MSKNLLNRINLELLISLLLVLAVNAPAFRPSFVVTRDTMYGFQAFSLEYQQLFYHHSWAYWHPYVFYGQPAFMFFLNSPVGYLLCMACAYLRVTDTAAVFKAVIVSDIAIFVTGVHLCARLIYKERAPVWMVGACAALCTVWQWQGDFNLGIYYLLPWVAYCIFSFFKTGNAAYVWATGLLIVFWTISAPPYFVGLYLLVSTILFVTMALLRPGILRHPKFFDRRSLYCGAALVVVAVVIGWFLLHMPDGIVIRSAGREVRTGKVTIGSFLTMGAKVKMPEYVLALLSGNFPHVRYAGYTMDCAVYFGIFPCLLAAVSVVWIRRPTHLAFFVVMIAVFVFAQAGLVAKALYYFPLMGYFRYIGFTLGLAKVAALFCAGFTLDEFLISCPRRVKLLMGLSFLLAAILGVLACGEIIRTDIFYGLTANGHLVGFARLFAYISSAGVSCWALRFGYLQIRTSQDGLSPHVKSMVGALIFAAVVVDMASYQEVIYRNYPTYPAGLRSNLTTLIVRPLVYMAERTADPALPEQKAAFAVLYGPQFYDFNYAMANEFCGYDPIYSDFRCDIKANAVVDLMSILNPDDRRFPAFVGGSEPKLRLVLNPILTSSAPSALTILSQIKDPAQTSVIEVPSGAASPARQSIERSTGEAAGSVEPVSFSSNELTATALVTRAPGAWLIYDDAYSRGWHVSVNGKTQPIYRADVAFKAVWLPIGVDRVRFWYRDGLRSDIADTVADIGAVAGAALLSVMFALCLLPDAAQYSAIESQLPEALLSLARAAGSSLQTRRAAFLNALDFRQRRSRPLFAALFIAGFAAGGYGAATSLKDLIAPAVSVLTSPQVPGVTYVLKGARGGLFATAIDVSVPSGSFRSIRKIDVNVNLADSDIAIGGAKVISSGRSTVVVELPAGICPNRSSFGLFQRYVDWPGDDTVSAFAAGVLVAAIAAGLAAIGAALVIRWSIVE